MGIFSSFGDGLGFGASSRAAQAMIDTATGGMTNAATGAAAGAAAPLVQQGVSALNSRNDESVILALLSQLKDDAEGLTRKVKLEKWQCLNDELSSHQRSELRKIIVNLKLPERFEQFESEKTGATQGKDGNQTRGPTQKFQRLPKDYEFTDNDYRIDVIEMLLEMETNEAVQCVTSMVSKLSAAEKAQQKAGQAVEATFRFSAALVLGPEYRDSMNKGEVIKALELRKAGRAVERARAQRQRRVFSRQGWIYVAVLAGAGFVLLLLSVAI